MNQNIDIENLIAKALSGEASATELAALENWKTVSPENKKYFDEMEKVFSISAEAAVTPHQFDTDRAWNQLKQQIARQPLKGQVRHIRSFNQSLAFRIAAMIIVTAGILFGVYKVLSPEKFVTVTIASASSIKEHTLPDSTRVVMNRNSQIAYQFTDKIRRVSLEGEAVFDLAKDPARPFEVNTGGLVIHDIGTVFNVKSHTGSDSVTVSVLAGEVNMVSPTNKILILKKGEEGLYLKSRDEFIKQAMSDTNAVAYKTKIFVFENANLEVVAQKLNEVYGTRILLSEAIRFCKITVTFKNEEPDDIIDVISSTLRLKVSKTNNQIKLDGSGCEED